MNDRIILITGGTGFAGSHLVDYLLEQEKSNIHVTAYGDNTSHVHQVLPKDHVHSLDLTQAEATHKLIEKLQPNQIYHLASISAVGSSFDQVKKTLDINTDIQLNLLEAVRQAVPKARVLAVASALVYQPQDEPLSETDQIGPVNPYGVSKMTQDCLAYYFYTRHQLDIVRVRPFNHIGERQSLGFVVPDFAAQIVEVEQGQRDQIKVGNLSAIRDFTDVKDIVKAYHLLMSAGTAGDVYNLGSGKGYSIKQILNYLIDLSDSEIEVSVSPELHRPVAVKSMICDNSKIKQLGWEPQIKIEQTLSRVLNYFRNQT